MKWPNPRINQIKTRTDLGEFLVQLAEQTRAGDYPVGHPSSVDFIAAAGRWTGEMDRYLTPMGEEIPDEPDWAMIAEIFCAALVYR
jgi:hypothetical protein